MQQESSFSDEFQFQDEYDPIELGDNDEENQKFIGEKQLNDLSLTTKVKQYFQSFTKVNKQKFIQMFNFKEEVPQLKSVCAKPIQKNQTIAQCYDCATDSTCIQCMPCFRSSNHEGHKVVIKKAYGGCCDCGDSEAWKKQGFCTKHTGETHDIQIDQKEQDNFVSTMKQLFFLLFWQSAKQNTNNCKSLSARIVSNLAYLNQKGVYYNKLTSIVFNSVIPKNLIVSKNINSRTIIANLLTPKIAQNLDIDKWIDLFFLMFAYYPFKKLLLETYMKNFSIIYDNDDESTSRGNSLSCQLMTSHQLVRQYAIQEGSVPLGADINMDKLNAFQNTFFVLYHDLNYITKLQGDTPQVYFKFHFTNKQALLKLFQYRKIIKKQQDKNIEEPTILQLARYVKYFQIQFKMLQLVAKIAGILQKDKQTLAKIIKILYDECLVEPSERKMIIFKPLTRVLALFLFSYFDLNLDNLTNNHQSCSKLLKQVLQVSPEQFSLNLSSLFKTCIQTYLFHSKILAQPGLNSTLYVYQYFYKIKCRFISSLDILAVKMLSMMHSWKQVNKQPVISPNDYIWSDTILATNPQAKRHQLQRKLQHLQLVLSELNLVSTSQSNQLYIAYQISPECNLYHQYIEDLLINILNQEKVPTTLQLIKQYEQAFFHPKVNLVQNILKKVSSFDKAKKVFILRKQYQQNNQQSADLLNYSDFRCNLTNKSEFQSPEKTLHLIKSNYNSKVFEQLYSLQTIKKFFVKGVDLMKQLSDKELYKQDQTPSASLDKLNPLFAQFMKIIYIKSKISQKPQQLKVVLEFLKRVQKIDELVNVFYHPLLHGQKMEVQKEQNDSNKNQQLSLPLLVSKSTSQNQKKLKLKLKMEQKKKSLKQKYEKQIASFEQEETIKLQKQQLQQEMKYEQNLQCIICRSDDQANMVYLVKVSYKNHQKLLGLGQGVMCLSIMSCYHPMDYECYQKLQKQVGNKKKPRIKCPFCKFSTNTFLPVHPHSPHVPIALKRLQVSLFIEKNLDQISLLQQIIKSFYHLSLLSLLDPQRTMHRRLHIYKIVLSILKNNLQLYDIKKVYQKFLDGKMNLNPKTIEEDQVQKRRAQKLFELETLLQQSGYATDQIQDLSQSQIGTLLNMMHGEMDSGNNQIIEESNQSQQANQPSFLSQTLSSLKNKLNNKFNKLIKSEEQKDQRQKTTKIFRQTMKTIFKELNMKEMDIEEKVEKSEDKLWKIEVQNNNEDDNDNNRIQNNNNNQKMQQIEEQNEIKIKDQITPSIQACLKALVDPKPSHHHISNIYEDLNQNNKLLRLRDLPLNFRPLGKLNKCQCCQQISPSISLCLLCDWQGCLRNCITKSRLQKNPLLQKGGCVHHAQSHGQAGLFLTLVDCQLRIIYTDGTGTSMGCIYKDQWGNDFSNKQQWQKFFLDEGELNKGKLIFLHEE